MTTVADIGRAQLAALCRALEVSAERHAAIAEVFDGIVEVCGDQITGEPPRWSGMSDDCSTVEWSVAFRRGAPDIRVLVEAQSDPPSLRGYAAASERLTRWLVENTGADDTLARLVLDAFEPRNEAAFSAAYHGVEFLHGGAVRTKLYLNPAVAGDPWDVARGALDRVGLGPTVDALRTAVGPMNLPLVAFDLEPQARARVKMYLRARSLEAYEHIGRMCTTPCADDFRPTTVAMHDAPLVARRPFIAVHLDATKRASPPKRAVYSLPVLELDGGVEATSTYRISRLLEGHGLDFAGFRRLIDALEAVTPPGPTDDRWPFGLPSWISIQREPDGSPRVTVYFRCRAFAGKYGWLSAADSPRTWPSPVLAFSRG